MEERIINEILKDTYTVDILRKRIQIIKLILERQIYRPNTGEVQKNDIEISQEKWLEKFDKNLLSGMNSQMYSSLTERIEKFIESIVPLTIYLVIVPDEDMVQKIGIWLRQNLNQPRLVFDYKIDPRLIGGCAIVYKGVYKDLSLRAKISDNKEKIMGEFRKYFKQ